MITITIHAGYHPEAPSACLHWSFTTQDAFDAAWAAGTLAISTVHAIPGNADTPPKGF